MITIHKIKNEIIISIKNEIIILNITNIKYNNNIIYFKLNESIKTIEGVTYYIKYEIKNKDIQVLLNEIKMKKSKIILTNDFSIRNKSKGIFLTYNF